MAIELLAGLSTSSSDVPAQRRALRTSQEPPAQPWRREIFCLPRLPRRAPRKPASRFERYPKAAYMTEIGFWRELEGTIPHRIRDAAAADGGLRRSARFSSRNRWLSNSARLRIPLSSWLRRVAHGGSGGRFRASIDAPSVPGSRQGSALMSPGVAGGSERRRLLITKSPQLELVLRHAEHLLNYAVEGRDRTGCRHRPADHCGQASRARDLGRPGRRAR